MGQGWVGDGSWRGPPRHGGGSNVDGVAAEHFDLTLALDRDAAERFAPAVVGDLSPGGFAEHHGIAPGVAADTRRGIDRVAPEIE